MTNNGVIERIAIVDDDIRQAEAIGELIIDAGKSPEIVEGHFEKVEDLVEAVQAVAQAIVCDNRLSIGRMAQFPGSEALARLYKLQMPGVLLTQYLDMDADITIRRWRPWIPVVLSRQDTAEDPDLIMKGIEICRQEFIGIRIPSRRVQRSLIRVAAKSTEGGQEVLDVFVATWHPLIAVRLPVAIIPGHLWQGIEPGKYLLASVNTDAENSAELFFENFEAAPEPMDLSYVFG